jgi:CHAT domain-containing protein
MKGNLGASYLNLGDLAHARELLEAVVAEPTTAYLAGYRYGALSSVYLQTKEYPRAVDAAERAVKAVREANNVDRLPTALYQIVEARRASGDFRGAIAATGELMAAIEQLRTNLAPSDFMKRGFGDWWASSFTAAVELHHELGEPGPAIEAAEAARARAFVDLLATRNVQGKPADRDRIAELQHLDSDLKSAGVDPAAPAAALTFRGDAAAGSATSSLVRRWRTADPELRSFVAAEPTSIADMIATAKRLRSTMLSFWVGARETVIGVVTPGGTVRTVAVPVASGRLEALARETQPGAPPAQTAVAAEYAPRVRGANVLGLSSGGRGAREALYGLLIKPVEALLPKENGAVLTIIPHGPLFLVSFAALIDGRGAYLIERYTIHYAPSAAVFQYTNAKRNADGPSRYLLVGDPADLPSRDGGDPLPPLPGSRQEVAAIVRTLRGRDVAMLTGASAHEDQVRRGVDGRTVLHFATHGVVRDDQPFESYLAFGRSAEGAAADGRLTAQEIYGLDLHADLVVLSACRTAAGSVTGDGIIGLTRAFMYAGTPRVVATLWDVADEPGLYLLPPLYAAFDRGHDAARALRSAQLGLIAQLRAGRIQVDGPLGRVTLPEDPLLWASFVLVGEP